MCFHYLSIKLCSKAISFENPHFRHWNGKWKSSIFQGFKILMNSIYTVHWIITFERWYLNTYFNIEITYYSNTIWNAHFDSNSDFSCFMSNASKTGFSRFQQNTPSTGLNITRSVDGIDFHGFSILYIFLQIQWNRWFVFSPVSLLDLWIGFMYYISNNPYMLFH